MKEEDTKRSCGRQFLLCLDLNQNKSDNQEIDRQIGDVPNSFGRQCFFQLAMATKTVAAWGTTIPIVFAANKT